MKSSPLSQAVEDYLKAIYKLQGDALVATSELARSLDVSAASATNMIQRLAEMQLVTYQSYRGARLTPAGEKIALEVIRHHRLLETYLREVMGYSWQMIHDEAEHLEHHISEAFEQKIDEMLGYPTHDPHGDPIPTADGQITTLPDAPLTDAAPGAALRVSRLADDDPARLHLLEDLGLLPGADVRVLARDETTGTLALEVGAAPVSLAADVAGHVYVRSREEWTGTIAERE